MTSKAPAVAVAPESTVPRGILVVDDDSVVRDMLVRVLTESGYKALPAVSGPHALQMLAANGIALVLLDLDLPEVDGWTTLAAMLRRHPGLHAIIITAWPHQQAAARAAGASGCFEKPLDFPGLLAAIARAVPVTPERANRETSSSSVHPHPVT